MAILTKTTSSQSVTNIRFNGNERVELNASQYKSIEMEIFVQKTPGQTGGRIEFYSNATATATNIDTLFTEVASDKPSTSLLIVDGASFEFRLPTKTTTFIKLSGFLNGVLSYSLIADDAVVETGFITGLTNVSAMRIYGSNRTKPGVFGVLNHTTQVKISQ